MSTKNERYGEDRPFIADPLHVRDVLINRLGSLFVLDMSKGTWGGGVEPLQAKLRREEYKPVDVSVIGGEAQFGTDSPISRPVGFIHELSSRTGSFFIACEWGPGFNLQEWIKQPKWERRWPLRFTHLLPEPGVHEPLIVDLDLYVISLLNLTTFTKSRTEELQQIIEPPAPPKPNLYAYPFY